MTVFFTAPYFFEKEICVKEYIVGLGLGIILINIIYTNIVLWERN